MAQTILRSGRDSMGNVQRLFDANTGETVAHYRHVVKEEDFNSPHLTAGIPSVTATAGFEWNSKTVLTAGTPSTAIVAAGALGTGAGGVVQLNLSAASEKMEATLYAADKLYWGGDLSLTFEARVNLVVLPSLAAVSAVWGMASAWADGTDAASYYMEFGCAGSGAINYRTKDGVNTVSTSSGVTVLVNTWHVYRIDATDPTNVVFSIDGVPTGGFAFAATGTNALLQPYASIYKAAGVGVGTVLIDYINIAMNRA